MDLNTHSYIRAQTALALEEGYRIFLTPTFMRLLKSEGLWDDRVHIEQKKIPKLSKE